MTPHWFQTRRAVIGWGVALLNVFPTAEKYLKGFSLTFCILWATAISNQLMRFAGSQGTDLWSVAPIRRTSERSAPNRAQWCKHALLSTQLFSHLWQMGFLPFRVTSSIRSLKSETPPLSASHKSASSTSHSSPNINLCLSALRQALRHPSQFHLLFAIRL